MPPRPTRAKRRPDTSDVGENPAETVEDADERGPLRRCIVTRTQGAPETMLRFVVSPEGVLVPDLAARLPGRGIWLSARRDVLDTARTRHLFARAARKVVRVPDDLDMMLRVGLERRAIECLTLARRAGLAVCGFTKCREWIAARRVGRVIHTQGASTDELARLMSGARELPVTEVPSAMLTKAFGRDHAVYAVIAPGVLARRFGIEQERLKGLADEQARDAGYSRVGLEQAGK